MPILHTYLPLSYLHIKNVTSRQLQNLQRSFICRAVFQKQQSYLLSCAIEVRQLVDTT